jgi:hypothetical protein
MFTNYINNHLNKICNSFDLIKISPPTTPPKLLRSYKTFCICGNITHVYNKERKGGLCYSCENILKKSKSKL